MFACTPRQWRLQSILMLLAAFGLAQAAMTGQKTCNQVICLTGIRDSTAGTDTFTIGPAEGQTLPVNKVGWMAMGFGDQMLNSPMCVMWPNSDGTFTLSQRMATQHVMPTVVANPPRKATLLTSQSFANSTSSSFSFSVPSSSDGKTSMIWATSTVKPGSSSASANLIQHDKMGVMEIDLSAALTSGPSSDSGDGEGDTTSSPSVTESTGTFRPPMALYAHVSFGALATMLFFPLGIITPRYARGFTTKRWWFPAHSALNGILGAICVVVAFSIARNKFGFNNFSTTHQKCGLALFILVLIQVFLGLTTHLTRHHPVLVRSRFLARRGPLNFFHITMGLAIVGLGWATVYEGLFVQWALSSGVGPATRGYKVAYAVLVGISGLIYLAGFILLPRQLTLEKEEAASASSTPPQVPNKEGRVRV